MPPVPKKRRSTQRQGRRRAQIKLKLPNLGICPNCGAAKLSHFACPKCGQYRHEKKQ